jgi:hypothetical protein
VIQYNKRDHPNAMPVEEMDRAMNKFGVPTFEAVAITGEGVFPTLKVLAGMVLESIEKMDNRRPGNKQAAAAASALRESGDAPAARKTAPAAGAKGAPATPARQARPAAAAPSPAPHAAPSRAAAQRKPAPGGRPTRASAPRVPAPPPAAAVKGSGRLALTTVALVLVAAAVAGVVYFVMQNPG